jgi:hypothetical protein
VLLSEVGYALEFGRQSSLHRHPSERDKQSNVDPMYWLLPPVRRSMVGRIVQIQLTNVGADDRKTLVMKGQTWLQRNESARDHHEGDQHLKQNRTAADQNHLGLHPSPHGMKT